MYSNILFSLLIANSYATPSVSGRDKADISRLIRTNNDISPFDRLLLAMQCIEENLGDGALFHLAITHPNVVEMIKNKEDKEVLNYLLSLPPTARNALRKRDTLLRNVSKMKRAEKKALQPLIKKLGLKKNKLK